MQNYDLIIVGGGLAGASLAVALRNTRLSIALVENHVPRRPEGWDARIYAISPANAAFLEQIGVWKHLDKSRIAPISAMQVAGDAGGRLDFSAYETGVDNLGWILESSLMACELWENVKRQSNVTLFCPARPTALAFGPEAATLTLDDGEQLSARLLVGADGRDSWIRQQAGLTANTTPYEEKGVVANFETEKPHHNIAFQWFTDDSVLAYLPLPDKRMSIVWSTPDAHADALCTLPAEEFCERVAAASGHTLGQLKLITPPAAFPLRLIRVPKTVAPRLALVGDAGHGIHPLSGHGINLGYQDAKALADLLSAAPAWQDIGDERFLARYQRQRREETVLMQTTTDTLRRLFRANAGTVPVLGKLLGPLRNLGMDITNRLPIAKNLLVRYALGLI
jgi:ubiquinone biosynthesis UbiH/UbiF/VisC/COQ6 family hydroxylase